MQRAGVSSAARWAHYEIRVEGILDPRRTGGGPLAAVRPAATDQAPDQGE
jgi:hypothetical protein